jgi:membrane-bound serine protease (ClpP class)
MAFAFATEIQAAEVGLVKVKGAIGPATANYIARAIEVSTERKDACLIIQLDTPGGALPSTQDIVQSFYASQVPIVVYVAPPGAWAGSAGCFITLASDVAAMAPGTSIGAAHPVSIGAGGVEKTDDVMKQKEENFYSSYIKGIAEERGRNGEWAASSVVNSKAEPAAKALELKVVDLIAKDTSDLLGQLDGREVKGKILKTTGASVHEIPMTRRESVLQMLSHPELFMIVMLAVIYGLIGELSNPGAVLPGVVGAIALILMLYMAAILPVNLAGSSPGRPIYRFIYRGRLCANAWSAHLRRDRGILSWSVDAIQSCWSWIRAFTGLHHSGDAVDGRLLYFRRWGGIACAIATAKNRHGGHDRPNRAGAGKD